MKSVEDVIHTDPVLDCRPGILVARRYRLSAPLGAGAHASVWEAIDETDGALRALKLASSREALRAEIDALLRIEHPGLPRVHDHGEVDGTAFIVMDRVVGAPLSGAVPTDRFVRIAADVANALAVLHAHGLVHGDVKPANVLIAADRAVLVDLGMSRSRGSGAASGTMAFMAPEALAGESSPSTDLYALGVTLAWTISGEHPVVSDPLDRAGLLRALVAGRGPNERIMARLPVGCRETVRALLAPLADRRAPSARSVLARLARDAPDSFSRDERAAMLELPERVVLPSPLIGRDDVVARAADAVQAALSGAGLGVAFVGAHGAGRRRVADETIRRARIAAAARGDALDVVDQVPFDIERPTLVRTIDATPAQIRTAAEMILRIGRFDDRRPPIALVATLPESAGVEGVLEVPIAPLARDEIEALISALAGRSPSIETAARWWNATAGLPGLTVLAACSAAADVVAHGTPAEVAAAVNGARSAGATASLPANARDVAGLLALAEAPLSIGDITQALSVSTADVAGLVNTGLAIERDGAIDLIGRAEPMVLDGVARARVAERFEAFLSRVRPADHAMRARAALAAGRPQDAARHAEAEANECARRPADRAMWLEIARTASGDPTRHAERLARCYLLMAEPARALDVLGPIADSPEVFTLRADALRRAGRLSDARTLAQTASRSANPAFRACAELFLARDDLDTGNPSNAVERLDRIDADVLSRSLASRRLEIRCLALLARGDIDDARGAIADAERLALGHADDATRARLRSLAGIAAQRAHGHIDALHAYREAWDLAQRGGDAHGAATYAVNAGAAELEAGSLGPAIDWLARGARVLVRLGRLGDAGRALANLASVHAFVGDLGSAAEIAERAEAAALEGADGSARALAMMVLAEASLRGADRAVGLETAAAVAQNAHNDDFAAEVRCRAARTHAAIGDAIRARELLRSCDAAPPTLRAVVALECELQTPSTPEDRSCAVDAVRSALAQGATLEDELDARRLLVRAARASDDERLAAEAAAQLAQRVDELASTLPEALATLFRDAHKASSVVTTDTRRSHTADATADGPWRRTVEILRELNSEERLQPLLERILDAAVELTRAARGFLLLKNSEGVLQVRTARNMGRRGLDDADLALSRSVAERVAQTGEAVLTVDASADGRFETVDSVHAMRLRSILAVPLIVHGETVGTVYVDDRFRVGAFGDDALEIVRQFADAAAIALHNARTQGRLRRALHRAERLSQELTTRVEAQGVELEATRRALAIGGVASGRYADMVGRGAAMQRTLALVDKVAPTTMPVLLLGESGTGKELIARAIHANSPRAARPFVAENCGAIPETLLESVLFGHVKGAFTGADRARAGLFEVADGGTLFLDEIGEMSAAMQAKLLRVLQDGDVRPVGGDRSRRVDVRVLAATHRDLGEMVRKGTFREDLFYRIAVMVVPVPALRERREDIPALIAHFIDKHSHRNVSVDRGAMSRLLHHSWPGNVRQLENEVMRACVLSDGTIREQDLSPAVAIAEARTMDAPKSDTLDLRTAVDDLERQLIERAMRAHGGNQSRAARALGLSRFGLQKKLKRFRANEADSPITDLADGYAEEAADVPDRADDVRDARIAG